MNYYYKEIPQNAIPEIGTVERAMLDLYMSGEHVPEQTLCDEFGRNYRSVQQKLRGDRYCHWLFIEVKEKGVIEARYLDPRHLSQDREQDALARAERRQELRRESLLDAINGASRVQTAFDELEVANQELFELQKKTSPER